VNQQVADCKRQAAARLQEAQASAASAASSGYLASSANKMAEARRLNERALDLAVTAQRLLREGATLSRVTTAEATLNWKLVDSRSKEVLGEGNASGAESAKASGLPADASAVDSTPEGRSLGRAAVDAAISVSIRSAAEAIANRVSAIPFRAKAVRVERGEVTINAGTNLGVRVGDTFGILNTAAVLTDPDTGRPLEAAPKPFGKLRVIRVQEKVAVARDLDHNLRIKRGGEVEWIGFSEPGLGEHREATPRLAPRP
jgi:Flagellar assembly protein T, C-terminal domain